MHGITNDKNVFFALLAISFGHYGHHQANIVQKFKKGCLHIVRNMLRYMGSCLL